MRTQLIFATTAAILAGTASSQAATVSTTDSFSGAALIYNPATDYSPSTGYAPPSQLGGYDGLLTFKGFDPALGTLNAVSISETLKSSLEFKQAYAFGSSILINASVFVTGQDPYGGAGFNLPYVFSIGSTVPGGVYDTGTQFSDAVSGVYTNNNPLTFAPFLASKIYVPVLGYVNFGPSTGSFFGDATSAYDYTMTITYDYTPAAVGGVPEPAAWALMLVGFGGCGAVLRGTRRRAVAA